AVVHGAYSNGSRESPPQTGSIPNTLSDALMAQLDRLGFGKEVAQHASVVGPEFDLGLLARVMVRTVDELTPIVVRLVDAHIFVRSDVSSEVYRFRHALIREIAYESLLRKNR